MPSPFPGMDPYLEDPAIWVDFHERFVIYCSDAINDRLPDRYDARVEERVSLVRTSEEDQRHFRGDVSISAISPTGAVTSTASGTLTLEPVTIPLVIFDEVHESRINIVRRSDRRLITVVELLSPTNKSGDGLQQYLAKRNSLLSSRVHLVEIDLLVGGERPPLVKPPPKGDYYVFVSRGNRRPDCDVFAWTVRQALPRIPIPLESPDPDLILDLAELFQLTYDRGRYARALRYGQGPPAEFDDETSRWMASLAKSTAG